MGLILSVQCPAKINEFLAVGPRDAVGYHPIRSVFQSIGLFDELVISDDASEDRFSCNWELPERNTVTKAWSLVKEFTLLPPLSVQLTKNIPSESGLGGGSSDAAGFLKSVSGFAKHDINQTDRFEIARAVGADVPFFLLGGRAVAEGYGERLTALPDLEEHWVVVAKPNVSCPTPEMYRRLDELGQRAFGELPVGLMEGRFPGQNDFELVAPKECLDLIERMKRLGVPHAGLTGSGAAVFGFCSDKYMAQSLRADLLTKEIPWVVAVQTLHR